MTTKPEYIPEDYDRIKVVETQDALLSEKFGRRANVVMVPRTLSGDFDGLASAMEAHFQTGGIQKKFKAEDRPALEAFRQTLNDPEMINAMDAILSDMDFMIGSGAKTHLRLLQGYSELSGTHEFHIDGNVGGVGQDIDRYIACYNDPVTQFVRNDDVLSIRGDHAECKPDAKTYSFHPGDMWKQRVRNGGENIFVEMFRSVTNDQKNRGFVHRAVESNHARLMLVGDHTPE